MNFASFHVNAFPLQAQLVLFYQNEASKSLVLTLALRSDNIIPNHFSAANSSFVRKCRPVFVYIIYYLFFSIGTPGYFSIFLS